MNPAGQHGGMTSSYGAGSGGGAGGGGLFGLSALMTKLLIGGLILLLLLIIILPVRDEGEMCYCRLKFCTGGFDVAGNVLMLPE